MDDEQNGHLQIGRVAQRTGLSVRTVRNYHDVGLVTPSARTVGGFRLYTETDVQRLLVLRRMKPLGFTLAEMKQLLESFDTLVDADATATQQASAREFLAECRVKAEASCTELRRHLTYAEELTELLSPCSAEAAAPSAQESRGPMPLGGTRIRAGEHASTRTRPDGRAGSGKGSPRSLPTT